LPLVTFYITGDPRRASSSLLAKKPDNVILTGFLQGGNYTALLKNAHGIVVLTKEPNALSCAAYEALVVGKPVVASEGPEMRRIFTRGFIYVNNSPEAIVAGIRQMLDEREALTKEAIAMREALIAIRDPTLEKFIALLK
jgi:glycosyltransferase involved in cell wall biosynthesis